MSPQQVTTAVENNFTKGLITESTGLNFPENATTDTNNCIYTLVGDVTRREGINTEINGSFNPVGRDNVAINSYKWNNAGGDGLTQIVVEQIGSILYFYKSSTAMVATPLSTQLLASTVNIASFGVLGVLFNANLECQFSDGNGYLFVYHPNCEPIYCSYNAGVITANPIIVQIRDFVGIPETIGVTNRPPTLNAEHQYNLQNQGWTSGSAWIANSTTSFNPPYTGTKAFTVPSGLTIAGGDTVNIYDTGQYAYLLGGAVAITGTVSSYVGTTLTITITFAQGAPWGNLPHSSWQLQQTNLGHITSWFTAIGNYPSNADVWWYFKNTSNVFDPTTTVANTPLGSANAPKGHYIVSAFNQRKDLASSLTVTSTTTLKRPTNGTWFQGRVWYTGIDDSQQPTGDAPYYTWTENIYFSKIVQGVNDFGACYQTNDPTSEQLFGLLPSDGGVITIQGSGTIYKLFALQNALLIFAANGVWYLTGSSGIGFSANDYTIVKLSSVRSISCTSYVDVQGLPYFWNEEGIYAVEPAKQGTSLLNSPLHVNPLEVIPITVGTILTFYNNIPLSSKKYARGAYHPIDYTLQWVYKDTEAISVTDRYTFNRVLNFNSYNKAFYPYTVDTSNNSINGIVYVSSPGGLNSSPSGFKYISSNTTGSSFADEHDTAFVDWGSINYISYFVTGFKLRGQAIKKFQLQYLQLYTRTNSEPNSYKIQFIWNFANNKNSGKWSSIQQINHGLTHFDTVFKRVKVRGNGYALQFKVISTDGKPFDIKGWAELDTINQGT